jgi:catechol 2,3-dioxygenase-like lactoylglutathione lyase family enzyme
MSKAIFKRAVPYKKDAVNLPVASVAAAVGFYDETFGFRVVSTGDQPHQHAVLARDQVQIGLAENGGDPTQEGCFFEVDDVDAAFAEIKSTKANVSEPDAQKVNGQNFKAFFVVAPDGLCYMIAQPQSE